MKDRRLFTLLGGICLIAVLAALPFLTACQAPAPTPTPPTPSPEVITLKCVSSFFSDDPWTQPLFPFIDKVNERAEGELVIEYVGGPEVMSEFDQYEAVAEGRMDLSHGTASFSPGVIKCATSQICWTVDSEGYRAKVHDLWNEIHHQANIELLGCASASPGVGLMFFLNEKVEHPSDFAGLKLGDGAIMPSGITRLGGTPTTVSYAELYTSLEQGVIDGLIYGVPTVFGLGCDEVTTYVLNIPVAMGDINYIMNLDKFNSLPAHLQTLIKEAAIEAELEADDYFIDMFLEGMQMVKDSELEFIEFSPEDTEEYLIAMYEGEWDAVIERNPVYGPQLKAVAYERGNWPAKQLERRGVGY